MDPTVGLGFPWLGFGIAVALLVILLLILWSLAGRIDRLHRRVVATRGRLARHLVKRSGHAIQLAEAGVLPKDDTKRLREAATAALLSAEIPLAPDGLEPATDKTDPVDVQRRLATETRLATVLSEVLTLDVRGELEEDPLLAAQLESFDDEVYRAYLALSLHNQDVAQVRDLRSNWLARIFHLAGAAPMPEEVQLDDQLG